MDVPRPSSAARRSTMSIPSKPDASLAEWTSKIKAMQKQVDDDEEAETRRLEAEIAASRKARMRRSTLGSRANSVDLCLTKRLYNWSEYKLDSRDNPFISWQIEDHPLVSFLPLNLTEPDSIETVLSHIDYTMQYGEDEEPKEVSV